MDAKLISAVVAYYHAQQSIKRLTHGIGESLRVCLDVQDPPGSDVLIVDHLKNAYAMTRDESGDGQYGGVSEAYYVTGMPPEDYLAETCPYCLTAHKLIQERKEARKQFGIAKRRISALGRSLSKGSEAKS